MIALVEGAQRQKTPNEIALTILLAALTFIFLLVCVTLKPFGIYSGAVFSVPVLVALLVCLIPTTIGGLLSAIGIAGMDRVLQRNVLAMSGRAVEAAGDVDVLLLDKTGTITLGNRMAVGVSCPRRVSSRNDLADVRATGSLADETPEGRSIVVLAKEKFGIARARNARAARDVCAVHRANAHERRRSSCATAPSRRCAFAKARRKPCADLSNQPAEIFPQPVGQDSR